MSCKGTCILVILLWVTYISSGCRCFTQHPQRIFCREDSVVLVGRVIKKEIPKGGDMIKYHFKLLKSLKGVHETIGSTIIIETYSTSSMCGVRFMAVGEQYVLSGRRDKKTGRIFTKTCGNFIYKITDVTFELMLYLFSGGSDSYVQNCDCKEIVNPRHEPGKFDSSKGCQLPSALKADTDCYRKQGLCKRTGSVCSWKNADCGP
ncbi:metalloproteinase inhibitor 3 [Mytilus galloprovincialis]|uniref:Metalloproteinase inhibitor 3 n=1 Tax=Mytilus galloprovincialis TaxID=29158 RepID=A0A8B6G1R7_MYTGA|nr:metalloproteinase inhibitor 3 [Mytilus galloprovincialis]